jgi:cytochrome bd-type quinol oxidase subunit 2
MSTDWGPGPESLLMPNSLNYAISFMWTLGTTFGYQPPTFPESLIECFFTIILVLVGIAMGSYVIGVLNSYLVTSTAEVRRIKRRRRRRRRMMMMVIVMVVMMMMTRTISKLVGIAMGSYVIGVLNSYLVTPTAEVRRIKRRRRRRMMMLMLMLLSLLLIVVVVVEVK